VGSATAFSSLAPALMRSYEAMSPVATHRP
jgi:hypothetical protein